MDKELSQLIDELESIKREARTSFGQLTEEQLNWKPTPEEWSVGQCLDHLIVSNVGFFPVMGQVAVGQYTPSFKERLPILPRLFGYLVLNAVKPLTPRKFKARPAFQPASSNISPDIISRFETHQSEVVEHMKSTDGIDLHKTIITSPIASFITYSLFNAYQIIVAHEQRHLAQAKRVLERQELRMKDEG